MNNYVVDVTGLWLFLYKPEADWRWIDVVELKEEILFHQN